MQFNSAIFPIYLLFVVSLYWAFNNQLYRRLLLLISSYIFYAWWDYRFLGLIIFSSLVDYKCGLFIEKYKNRKTILIISIFTNLGVLGFFKYFNFFIDSFIDLFNILSIYPNTYSLNIILPIGISFYTFQSLSYTIDVYRNKIKPCEDPITFFIYVSFFPQLVAGPIERANNLIPQIINKQSFNVESSISGIKYIIYGLFLKMVLSDNISVYANDIGLISYPYVGLNNSFCASNKIYEYLINGLIVFSTDQSPLSEIVDYFDVGETIGENYTMEAILSKFEILCENIDSKKKNINKALKIMKNNKRIYEQYKNLNLSINNLFTS